MARLFIAGIPGNTSEYSSCVVVFPGFCLDWDYFFILLYYFVLLISLRKIKFIFSCLEFSDKSGYTT